MDQKPFVVKFGDVDKQDIALVGGKGANLGEMAALKIPAPDGFIVTAPAYFYFLDENKLRKRIKENIGNLNPEDPNSLNDCSKRIKKLINSAPIPKTLATEIMEAYIKLGSTFKQPYVAVRSSATAEDLPDASFAGQQETYLNIRGEANVVNSVRNCWASLFEPRAIFYRNEKGFNHFKVGIAVPVQKMIQSEVSGVMFTIDPVTNDKSKIMIEAIWGLGELIVQGIETPDRYDLDKSNLEILHKSISKQLIYLTKKGTTTLKRKVPGYKQKKQKLDDQNIKKLAKLGLKLHKHYFFPQDIEWAFEKGKLYIVQTRPVTTISTEVEDKQTDELKKRAARLPIIVKGDPASPGIASGPVKNIKSARQINKVISGDVLVTQMTTPDFVPAMKKAAAIVTDEGGRTCHAAIVSRELGIPCIVGTDDGTKKLKNGTVVTVNASDGIVYRGSFKKGTKTLEMIGQPALIKKSGVLSRLKTATKVYVNLGEPELAVEMAKRNVDGVGLLRAEFMISERIGIHPKKLLKDRKSKFFVDKLAEGIAEFAKAFDPRPVVYRATDFKTSEYRNLIGGKAYEPEEPNPMLGYRGCFRYIHDEKVFEMELEAISRVRNKYGHKNIWLMIPFVRKYQELIQAKRIVAAAGLRRSATFKLWMMVEIPSNVILLKDFIAAGIDGVSIGSNDLTMLILGTDRDNDEVAPAFDERDPAVLWALEKVIKTCQKEKITSSICGQAPSEYPDLVEKIVDWGITSISVNPDAISRTRQYVYQAESKKAKTAK